MPFVVSLSNHERPFDKLRANGTGQAQGRTVRGKVQVERYGGRLRANGDSGRTGF